MSKISGYVTIAGKPDAEVIVKLHAKTFTLHCPTDQQGHYAFTSVPDQQYELIAGSDKVSVKVEGKDLTVPTINRGTKEIVKNDKGIETKPGK